jgi:hypothetical protein
MKEHAQKLYHQTAQKAAEAFLYTMDKPEEAIFSRLSTQAADNIEANCQVLTSLFRITEVLGRQGLAFRGSNDDGVLQEENCSNFNALLQLAINSGDENLRRHLEENEKRRCTYVSKTTQNRLIGILGDQLLNRILQEVRTAQHFSLLADEVSDASNWEQLSVVMRFVDSDQKIREEFIGFIKCADITGETLFRNLQDQLREWGLDANNIRGQGYDGASNMTGKFKGVKSRFLEENDKALFFHCASHCLSLCVVKACRLPSVTNMMGTLKQLSLFFSLSPKRQRKLEQVIKETLPDSKKSKLVDLCRTRWVEKHKALETFSNLYLTVFDTLAQMCEDTDTWDSETLTKATGFLHTIASSSFMVSFIVVRNCLRYLKPLTVKLQKLEKDIVEAYKEISIVSTTISTLRENVDTVFGEWFEEVTTLAGDLSTNVTVPRQACRQTQRDNPPAATPEQYMNRSIAIPFLDHLSCELKDRFKNSELAVDGLSLVPSTFANTPNQLHQLPGGLQSLAQLWETDLPDSTCVAAEYHTWLCKWRRAAAEGRELPSSVQQSLQECSEQFFPNLHTLLRLICTLPVTTAECERTISHIRTLKSYLRSTMGQERLNGLALMKIHRMIPLDLSAAVTTFGRRFNTQMNFLPKNLVQQ